MPILSIVVPSFNEQDSLGRFYHEVLNTTREMDGVTLEILFVDDGSTDGTLSVARKLREADARVRFVSLSRRFGKEAAILAGLKHSSGDLVALMDADLQDPPALLPDMYRAIMEDHFDCAAARRRTRPGGLSSFLSGAFYRLFNRVSTTKLVSGARDFRLMTRQMVDAILSLSEVNRFSKGLMSWVGFRTTWIEYENVERSQGRTKWSFLGLVRYATDGLLSFSTAPLMFASGLGFLFCSVAFIWVAVIVVRTLAYGNAVPGWSSLACVVLFASGLQLLATGILGQYLAKTYLEAKHRPVYIVRETEEGSAGSRANA